LQDTFTSSGRGREAEKPSEIPAKGWKDIAWRVYDGIQDDRVLLVAAGVTFYALLALFPATAAIVSLYGLFADATTINEHLRLISGFLPDGALEVIGDQVKRIAAQGQGTLGLTFVGTLVLSLWGANAGTKSIFDALNIIYKEREKRSFISLTLYSLTFTLGAIALAVVAMAGIVAVPVALKLLGIPAKSAAGLLTLLRWPCCTLVVLFALALSLPFRAEPHAPAMALGDLGSAIRRRHLDRGLPPALLVCREFRHIQRHLRLPGRRDRLHGVDVALDHRRSDRRGDQRRDGAPDRRGHDRGRPQAHGRARRHDGRRDRRGACLSP
jgi:uncharacterized BrkB/YihY/UPF0761 family membrane protein